MKVPDVRRNLIPDTWLDRRRRRRASRTIVHYTEGIPVFLQLKRYINYLRTCTHFRIFVISWTSQRTAIVRTRTVAIVNILLPKQVSVRRRLKLNDNENYNSRLDEHQLGKWRKRQSVTITKQLRNEFWCKTHLHLRQWRRQDLDHLVRSLVREFKIR